MIHGALFEHTAHDHHWLVVGFEFGSLSQAVHTPGVDSPLEPEGWVVVVGHLSDLILYCCLFVVLKEQSQMAASLMEPLDLWLLVCLWSVPWQHKQPQVLEACRMVPVHRVKGCACFEKH